MDAQAGDVDVPRVQSGPNPQHLLSTVLGEYLDSSGAELPATTVVAVLAEFGVTPASARAALSRLTRRGILAVRGGTRPPVYSVTPQTIARHRSTMHRLLAFGAVPRQGDGSWLTVSYSLPESGQAQRHAVRKSLGELGFVRLYDSLWISPDADPEPVRSMLSGVLDAVPGARWSVLHVRFDDEAGPHGPGAAYDLTGLASDYRRFVDGHAALRAATRAGRVGAAEALVARTTLMDDWRRFALTDPDLPAHLLPDPWPRQDARELFLEVHTELGPLAQERLVEVMQPTWPDAGSWVTYFVAADDPAAPPRGGRGSGIV
ncbi:PaaX family transcriptional regulator C-terminal domain-containing protein [Cellulomonas sp. Leaf334]|uniref:PaaX family transcriptional regulator n=1 Tax=Cellulomonas sp. Leaf334 TaxID=1736339 RepID=UPI0006F4BC9F|nr:PaaX family transcriptional regulator C-terminal domain-containing protein [Cellulomonas sp. Leaf334]KQR12096.1 PaaX family transcriptional regulator [Cellulomonas sp. Leaf334]